MCVQVFCVLKIVYFLIFFNVTFEYCLFVHKIEVINSKNTQLIVFFTWCYSMLLVKQHIFSRFHKAVVDFTTALFPNSWTHVMTTACWWGTGVVITHTVSRRRPGPAAWRSSWTTPAAEERPSATPSAGSTPPSSTPVRTRTRHSLIGHMIGVYMIVLLLPHSLALSRDPREGRDKLLLCPRQWRQP